MSCLQACRILVVNDLPDNLMLLQMVLELEGYLVAIANDAASVMAQLEADLPDLVLMDVMMPEMDSYKMAHLIRQDARLAALPIVLESLAVANPPIGII